MGSCHGQGNGKLEGSQHIQAGATQAQDVHPLTQMGSPLQVQERRIQEEQGLIGRTRQPSTSWSGLQQILLASYVT